jgi:hypothetical protein
MAKIDRIFDRRHPGDHPVSGQYRRWKGVCYQQYRQGVERPVMSELDPPSGF